MPAKKAQRSPDINTESKIKAAARVVFHKKGFAATRTRDIAEEAGINLALLNYYFRSKEKLFELIMFETLFGFLHNMAIVFNDETTTLQKKVELIADKYIDLIIAEPEIPLFIMSELRSDATNFLEKLPVLNIIMQSAFIKQYQKAAAEKKITEHNPLHFVMNLMGLVIFPFIGSPMLKKVGRLSDRQFDKLMQERKKLVPVWMKAMLKAK
jgi:AcrR family transcriptional regulator